MAHSNEATVIGEDGQRGKLEAAVPEHDREGASVPVRLESGQRVMVPADLLTRQDGDTYRAALRFSSLSSTGRPSEGEREEETITLVEEQLRVGRREVERGRVRITKRVEHHEGTIDEPVLRERVEVERVPINREIDGPVEVRREGDVTIIPVYEEVLVIEKRLMLKEELHVRKERHEESEPQHVTLRREHVEVERIEGEGGEAGPAR